MILHSLYELYDRLKDDPAYMIAPPGFSLQKITFQVVITPEGKLFEIQDAREPSGTRLRPKQRKVPGGTKSPGSGLNPCFLWDNTGYMLGFKPDDPKPQRTKETFEAFRTKHLELEPEINTPAFSAVCRFLDGWDPAHAADYPVLVEIATGFGVFQLQGVAGYVHDDPAIQAWWQKRNTTTGKDPMGQCLVTGEMTQISRLHTKIKGVAGGKSDASLVSFNEAAYESYGKEQSFNAPVSTDAAFRYSSALNALLDGPMQIKHRFHLGDATVAFWTGEPTLTEDIFAEIVSGVTTGIGSNATQDDALREKLEAFLRALRKGRKAYADLEGGREQTPFFLLGLSPNAARLSIRFFHRCMLSDLLENLRRHYDDIRIQPQRTGKNGWNDPEFPPLPLLLDQTCPRKKGKPDREKIPRILAGPLLRSVIAGTHYPRGLFSAVLRRIHADHIINYPRACVIKGTLTRNLGQEVSMSLDVEREEVSYRLGRLFAALEKTQKDALPSVSVTIRERFYSAASATPRTVFPRLLRTYQHHLAKLEGGRKVNREKLVQEILGAVRDFPAQLNLGDQGLFAIGYYHQTQDFYTVKKG